jgi:hypothetical protein
MRKKIPQNTKYFTYYNANPKGKVTGDCVIRALSNAMNKTWDEVLTDLYKYALKYKQMLNDDILYKKYLKDNGWVMLKQPRKWDNTKYTGIEFCKELQEGCCFNYNDKDIMVDGFSNIIAHIGGHHIIAIKDCKIIDTWDSGNGCIGNIWVKK